jgi:predicted transcriptional regulator
VCVRPDHLFLGTQVDNNADMVAKGRQVTVRQLGERNSMARLTDTQVREIRRRYIPGVVLQRHLAAEYGVTQMLISQIVLGKIWQHLL